jgi:uncharacterized protein with PIN domain
VNIAIEASFRFYGDLNDVLSAERRHRAFVHRVESHGSIKDVIESVGVPHPEIDLIIVNGQSVDFTYRPRPGDRIAVYPVFRELDTAAVSLVRPPPLDVLRFVLDAHLGRLTAYLRLVGLDCLYSREWDDERLAAVSHAEKRVLLSRDVALLKRSMVEYGCFVRNTDPRHQLAEVAGRFPLRGHARPCSRCVRCNTPLEPVAKQAVADRLPPRTREHFQEFHQCPACGKVYWKGGHYTRIRAMIQELVDGDNTVDSSQ